MFMDTVDNFATVAAAKVAAIRTRPAAFFVSAMMAGAYVGLGIILIFSVGAVADPSIRPVVLGASFAVALTFVLFAGGGGLALGAKSQLLVTVAGAKMTAPALELFARAILCNWLVCLAIWMAARMTSDTGKCIAIFWCLYAFVASGFEHSVANMTVFLVALFAEHPATVTYGGMLHNLLWVTLGNIVSGAGFMGIGYWIASGGRASAAQASLQPVSASAD